MNLIASRVYPRKEAREQLEKIMSEPSQLPRYGRKLVIALGGVTVTVENVTGGNFRFDVETTDNLVTVNA